MIYISHMAIMIFTLFAVTIVSSFHPILGGFTAMMIVGLHWVIIGAYKDKIKELEKGK